MTSSRPIHVVCRALEQNTLEKVHGSSVVAGSNASAAIISHWAIIISAEDGKFDKYELLQCEGNIVIDYQGHRNKKMEGIRFKASPDTKDIEQERFTPSRSSDNKQIKGHRPACETTKTRKEIFTILQNDPHIKKMFSKPYDILTNNCQIFVTTIVERISLEVSRFYLTVLLLEQKKVISKVLAFSELSNDTLSPPSPFNKEHVGRVDGLHRFAKFVTQAAIDYEMNSPFLPQSVKNARWHPANPSALFTAAFKVQGGYFIARDDKEAWGILRETLVEEVGEIHVVEKA